MVAAACDGSPQVQLLV